VPEWWGPAFPDIRPSGCPDTALILSVRGLAHATQRELSWNRSICDTLARWRAIPRVRRSRCRRSVDRLHLEAMSSTASKRVPITPDGILNPSAPIGSELTRTSSAVCPLPRRHRAGRRAVKPANHPRIIFLLHRQFIANTKLKKAARGDPGERASSRSSSTCNTRNHVNFFPRMPA